MTKVNAAWMVAAVALMTLAAPGMQAQQPLLLAGTSSSASLPDAPLPTNEVQADQTAGQGGTATAGQTQAAGGYVQGKQTKRILGIVPNFRAVSADQKLPPQSVKEKFTTTMQDSFDYSAFIFVGVQAGRGTGFEFLS